MGLDNSAELVGKRALNGINSVVANLHISHLESVGRHHDIDVLQCDLVDDQVDGDILNGFGSDEAPEAHIEPTAVLVLRFNRSRAHELESCKVAEVHRREPFQLLDCRIERIPPREQVYIASCSRVDRASEHRVPTLQHKRAVCVRKHTAQ